MSPSIYDGQSKAAYELIVNDVKKDTIAGYLAVPKVQKQPKFEISGALWTSSSAFMKICVLDDSYEQSATPFKEFDFLPDSLALSQSA